MTERKKPNFKRILLVALMVTAGAGLVLFTGALLWIGIKTSALERTALEAFPGTDATQSMVSYINDASLCQYELSKAINPCGGSVQFAYADKRWNR